MSFTQITWVAFIGVFLMMIGISLPKTVYLKDLSQSKSAGAILIAIGGLVLACAFVLAFIFG